MSAKGWPVIAGVSVCSVAHGCGYHARPDRYAEQCDGRALCVYSADAFVEVVRDIEISYGVYSYTQNTCVCTGCRPAIARKCFPSKSLEYLTPYRCNDPSRSTTFAYHPI